MRAEFKLVALLPMLYGCQTELAVHDPKSIPIADFFAPIDAPYREFKNSDSHIIGAYLLNNEHSDDLYVLVHGWMCDARYWNSQLPVLSSFGDVAAVDLPGHGEVVAGSREEYSIDQYANDLNLLINSLKSNSLANSVTVIGHSMGGYVGVVAAAKAESIIDHVVVVDSGKYKNANKRGMTDEESKASLEALRLNFLEAMKTEYRQRFFPVNADYQLVTNIIEDMAEGPSQIALELANDMNTLPNDVGLKSAQQKAAISFINSDYAPVDGVAIIDRAPSAKFYTLNGTGHFPMLEDSLQFNESLISAISHFEKE